MAIKDVEQAVDFSLDVIEGYRKGNGEFTHVGDVLNIVEQTLRLVRVKFNSDIINEFLQDEENIKLLDSDAIMEILNKLVGKE